MYDHLLVPVSDDELSERAMSASVELARRLGTRITGFIAEPFAAPAAGAGLGYGESVAKRDSGVEAHAQGVLKRFEALATQAGVPFTSRSTQSNNIEDAILAAAADCGCDMIVMATHGRSGFGELLWGSHTKNMVSRAKVPLLVLH